MPCVGKAGLRSESQNVQKLREALGLPGVNAGRPYGTEPLLRMAAEAETDEKAQSYIQTWKAFLSL